jgi:hypothetical protein
LCEEWGLNPVREQSERRVSVARTRTGACSEHAGVKECFCKAKMCAVPPRAPTKKTPVMESFLVPESLLLTFFGGFDFLFGFVKIHSCFDDGVWGQ